MSKIFSYLSELCVHGMKYFDHYHSTVLHICTVLQSKGTALFYELHFYTQLSAFRRLIGQLTDVEFND